MCISKGIKVKQSKAEQTKKKNPNTRLKCEIASLVKRNVEPISEGPPPTFTSTIFVCALFSLSILSLRRFAVAISFIRATFVSIIYARTVVSGICIVANVCIRVCMLLRCLLSGQPILWYSSVSWTILESENKNADCWRGLLSFVASFSVSDFMHNSIAATTKYNQTQYNISQFHSIAVKALICICSNQRGRERW